MPTRRPACLQIEIDFKAECHSGELVESLAGRTGGAANQTGVHTLGSAAVWIAGAGWEGLESAAVASAWLAVTGGWLLLNGFRSGTCLGMPLL